MDFLDGITFHRFELEGWDLVQCLLIAFCFGSKICKEIRPPQPPENTPKPPKHFEYELYDYIFFLLSRTGFAKSLRETPVKRRRENEFGKKLFIHTHTHTHSHTHTCTHIHTHSLEKDFFFKFGFQISFFKFCFSNFFFQNYFLSLTE